MDGSIEGGRVRARPPGWLGRRSARVRAVAVLGLAASVALAWWLAWWRTSASAVPAEAVGARAAHEAHGVFWPGAPLPVPGADPRARAELLRRASALEAAFVGRAESPSPRSPAVADGAVLRGPASEAATEPRIDDVPGATGAGARRATRLEFSRLAAALGDFDAALNGVGADPPARTPSPPSPSRWSSSSIEERSLAAAALYARALVTGSIEDLLDAAERLARLDGADLAAACNRVRLWESLGLSHRAKELLEQCPALAGGATPMEFAADRWGDGRASANDLPPGEIAAVEALLAVGDRPSARARVRRRAQGFRVHFERDGLARWIEAAADPDPMVRAAHEERLRDLAELYGEATGNAAPRRLVEDLVAVPALEVDAARAGLRAWLEGVEASREFRTARAEEALRRARYTAARWLPSLQPLVDLALVGTLYQVADNREFLRLAAEMAPRLDESESPWASARAGWFLALAHQGFADWESSLLQLDRATRLFERLGETAGSAFLELMRGFDLESLNQSTRATESYVRAIRGLAAADDAVNVPLALQVAARQQSARGRESVALEMQREALAHSLRDGRPEVLAESQVLLAERLLAADRAEDAARWVAAAGRTLAALPPDRSSARLHTALALTEARVLGVLDPRRAIERIEAVLAAARRSGERYDVVEARMAGAMARLRLGDLGGVAADAERAIAELVAQAARVPDAPRAVAVLDRLRPGLDSLLVGLVAADPADRTGLAIVERMAVLESSIASGRSMPPALSAARLPAGACATRYHATGHDLLAWTICGGGGPQAARSPLRRRDLAARIAALGAAARSGDLRALERASDRLSAVLLAGLPDEARNARHWLVAADQHLAEVPFAWLRREGRFLFESVEVQATTSLAEIGPPRRAMDRPWRVLAVGDPESGSAGLPALPAARREAQAIARRFPGSRALLGAEATLAAVRDLLPLHNVLHYAGHVRGGRAPNGGHGTLRFAAPAALESGLVAGEAFAAHDVAHLELAVLAGCASLSAGPRDRLANGSAVAGAMVRAGARVVLGTLWDVADATVAEALDVFYQGLAEGQGPRQSLRRLRFAAIAADSTLGVDLGSAVSLQLLANELSTQRDSGTEEAP